MTKTRFGGFLAAFLLTAVLSLSTFAQTKSTTSTAAKAAKAPLVDINSASADALKALPGIGEAYSAKIIVPQKTYDGIKVMIIAKQTKMKKKK